MILHYCIVYRFSIKDCIPKKNIDKLKKILYFKNDDSTLLYSI